MSKSRENLIRIQKEWVQDLKDRIFGAEERKDPELDRYYSEYRQEFQKGYERPATRKELTRQLERADIAYFGDFHTLKIAQQTVVTLLTDLREFYEKPIILALEMVHTRYQGVIDDYLAGKMRDDEFLAAINYKRHWGFDWDHYRVFFEFARSYGCKVIGLNRRTLGKKNKIKQRDHHAAHLISAASQMYPDHLVAAVFGDLHIGSTHLPAEVDRFLARADIKRQELILYQNSETFYWELVAKGQELIVDAVKMRKGVYCIMNATPLVKFQSWSNWQEAGGELEFSGLGSLSGDYEGAFDLSDQFANIVTTISEFLKVEHDELEDFDLYTIGDLGFLDDLVARKVYGRNDIKQMREVIETRRSAFFLRERVVYLGSLSINVVADLAARYIFNTFAGEDEENPPGPKEAFYTNVLIEAIGVFGIMIMNQRYRVRSMSDHRAILDAFKGKRKLSPQDRNQKAVSEYFLEHAEMLQRLLANEWARNNLRKIYQLEPNAFRGVTRAIGAWLGLQLFHALDQEKLPLESMQKLVRAEWHAKDAYGLFLDLSRTCKGAVGDSRAIMTSL